MVVLNHAMLLLVAGRLSGSEDYERHVHEHIHYVFGANVMGMSYVTGFGDKPILHPHHRPSEGDGVEEPVPGLVSGGPNKGLHDDYAREHLAGKAPADLCRCDGELFYQRGGHLLELAGCVRAITFCIEE